MSLQVVAVASGAINHALALPFRQKPQLATIMLLRNQLFEAMVDFERRRVDFSHKIIQVKTLTQTTCSLKGDCLELLSECERTNDTLPFYHFLPKVRFWMAQIGLQLIASFVFGDDENSCTYVQATSTLRELRARVTQLVHKELEVLNVYTAKSCKESFDIISLYEALCELEPENSLSRQGMAKWLLQEKAYAQAAKTYALVLESEPHNYGLHIEHIKALIGDRCFRDAQEKIRTLKLMLSVPQRYATPESESDLQSKLNALDELKADCLAEQKQFTEALDILRNLLKKMPQNNAIKLKVIFYTISYELDQLPGEDLSDLQKKFFLAIPKQLYASLTTHQEVSCTQDSLICDLEFWLDALFAQKKLIKCEKLKKFILTQVADLMDSGLISRDLIIKKIEERLNRLHESLQSLEERFYAFVQSVVQPSDERQLAILKARKVELEQTLHGNQSVYGQSGILNQREIAGQLLKRLTTHANFQENAAKIPLLCLANRLEAEKRSIGACEKSFVQLRELDSQLPLLNG